MPKPLHETIAYPDHSFPYIMYTHTLYTSVPEGRGFNDLHWHEELQITLVTKGTLVIQVNGVDHELKTGQAILINKGILHVTTQLSQDGEYVSFNFPEKLLAFHADSTMEEKYVLPYTRSSFVSIVIADNAEWEKQALDMLWNMRRVFIRNKNWGWEYEISIMTVQLWFSLISNLSLSQEDVPKHAKRQQERLQLMLSFIHQNYSSPITLREIADTAHLSISECTRSFKKTVHMTPYEYLIKYRIKKSCELLVTSDDTITEIAGKVGFNHVNHFIQSFKKDQGRTPKGFREFRSELEKTK
ncbi:MULTISPECIES: AraC family transcriptional regulator [unclassified Paenibacillus]|uniref:AraC family transcriptional regulator n=1 Tax=unclassified Paenibacillus TaxID=185978 RepID=UPI000FE23339|nr:MULTISPECIES: AraC family transcriptional regulator [unclassified Paenibacillus]MCM3174583.1 AraC family transcriptional regulator [Paenibacillus sp. MER 99-2]